MIPWNRRENMPRNEKALKFEELYMDKMQKWKTAYKERTEFTSKFQLKPEKTKGLYSLAGDPNANKEGEKKEGAEGGGAVAGGADYSGLPTIANYNGPDTSVTTTSSGRPYRSGLKGNLEGTDKWNNKIMEWAKAWKINPMFIKITMALESGGDEKLQEKGGNHNYEPGRGLFQITLGAVDGNYDRGKLFDPDYNAQCFIEVINGKIADAKRKGSPETVYEISWRYNGKPPGKITPYPKVVDEIMKGYGKDSAESIYYNG